MHAYHEQCNTLNGDIDKKESQGANIIVDVEYGSCKVMKLHFLILLCSALGNQSFFCNPSLSLVQEPCVFGMCGHNVRSSEPDDDGKETFKKEDVPPAMDTHCVRTPFRNSSKSGAVQISSHRDVSLVGTYPVARRPPNAPAIDAAET